MRALVSGTAHGSLLPLHLWELPPSSVARIARKRPWQRSRSVSWWEPLSGEGSTGSAAPEPAWQPVSPHS